MWIGTHAKSILTNTPAWRAYRKYQIQESYVNRARHYNDLDKGGIPQGEDLVKILRKRLNTRGWSAENKKIGQVHTLAVIPSVGWHATLVETLREIGKVSTFSFEGDRYFWRNRSKKDWLTIRKKTNQEILDKIKIENKKHPIDWIFFYTQGLHILKDTVRNIRDDFGIPTVMMCLDDKHSWEGERLGGQRTGQIDLVSEFDLYWTSARVCLSWILAEGGRPIYMPEGCDPVRFSPKDVEQDIAVSFVGRAYGFRKDLIKFLQKGGIPVVPFGSGWSDNSEFNESKGLVDVFNRSQINLGHGGIGCSEDLTNLKGRDFEVPCTGGGMYLTTFNSDLAQHFEIGQEIACYHGREELVDLVHYYLRRPDERMEIARRARARCLREHRWIHRYIRILQILGIFDETVVAPPMP